MSEFLSKILATKQQEVDDAKRSQRHTDKVVRSEQSRFAEMIRKGTSLAIVAEVKKASPSKGLIQPNFNPVATAQRYEDLGASAISVLTDQTYFQGSIQDLASVRSHVEIPVLRKDFIIDEVQIHEAVQAGADAVLLICAALSPERLASLSRYAKSCGLDVLVEVHDADELSPALSAEPSVLGINNRDLQTFTVDLAVTEKTVTRVPQGIPVIAESGIFTAMDAQRMAAAGVDGLLVGESLMRKATSDGNMGELLQQLQQPKQNRFSERSAAEAPKWQI